VTGDAIARLRAGASRADYASMASLARALYDAGQGPPEVLRNCYGVDFPPEFFVIAEAGPMKLHLLFHFTNQPWELAVPPNRGGPTAVPDWLDGIERKVFARDPDLVPLGLILDLHTRLLDRVLCYRLAELAAGRSAVFGIGREATAADTAEPLGDGLLAVLHEHHVDVLRWHEWKFGHPSNRGAGSIELSDVAEVRSLLERVEELQSEVASRPATS